MLGAGSFFGEDLLTGQRECRQSAVAIEPSVVLRVRGDRFKELLRTQQGIHDHILRWVITRHIALEDTLVHLLLGRAKDRLVHTLLTLAECNGATGRCPLPHLSQEIIAEMIGTTRSRVNLFMNRFKKTGFLETDSGTVYVNPSLLPGIARRKPARGGASAGLLRRSA